MYGSEDPSSDEQPKYLYERGPNELREDVIPRIKPFRTSRYKLMKPIESRVDKDLQAMWRLLFVKQKQKHRKGDQQQVSLLDVLPFKPRKSDKTFLCHKYFDKKEQVFVCYDCGNHNYSYYCAQCFRQSDHKGHRYQYSQQRGGVCCCGNQSAIKAQGFCHRHVGTSAQVPEISKEQKQQFMKYFCTLFEWYYKMRERDDRQSLMLLNHMFYVLFTLNQQSIYYNILTFGWLTRQCANGKTMLKNILEIGSYNLDTCLPKLATLVMFQLYGLKAFKELLLKEFIYAWNNTTRFQDSAFHTLSLHLFMDAELVKKIIPTIKEPLNPVQKNKKDSYNNYNSDEYFCELEFIEPMGPEVFRSFFRPIVEGPGIDLYLSEQMQDKLENGVDRLENYIKDKLPNIEAYIRLQKQVANYFQGEPEIIKKQIKRQFDLCKKYKHKNNTVLIPHPRSWAIFTLTYFKGNILKVDPKQLMGICGINQEQFVERIFSIFTTFMKCLRQFALCLSNKNFDGCDFDKLLPSYVQDEKGSQFFVIDCLGIRMIVVMLNKLKKDSIVIKYMKQYLIKAKQSTDNQQQWSKKSYESMIERRKATLRKQKGEVIKEKSEKDDLLGLKNMDVEVMMQNMFKGYQPCTPEQLKQQSVKKINKIHSLYLFELLHYFLIIFQCIFIQRPQIMVANDCGIKSIAVKQASLKQWKQIFKNMIQIPSIQMSKYFNNFFGSKGDIMQAQEVADLDKLNGIYKIKPNIRTHPLCKDLLHSFYQKEQIFDHLRDQLNHGDNKSSIIKKLLLNEEVVDQFMQFCYDEFEKHVKEHQQQLLQLLTSAVKLIGHIFGFQKERFKKAKLKVLQYGRRFSLDQLVNKHFNKGLYSAQQKQDKFRQEQRKRKQRQEQQDTLTELEKHKKDLAVLKKVVAEAMIDEGKECLFCKKKGNMCYMGWYGESSNIFNIFGLKNSYPFILSCLHAFHIDCYEKYQKQKLKNMDMDMGQKQIVNCLKCDLPTNTVYPGEKIMVDPQKLKYVHARLDKINKAEFRTNFTESFPMYLTKGIVSLFFHMLTDRKKIKTKRVVIYKKMLVEMLKMRYKDLLSIQRQRVVQFLKTSHLQYKNQIPKKTKEESKKIGETLKPGNKSPNYPLDELFRLVNMFTLEYLQQNRLGSQKQIEIDFNICKHLDNDEIERCILFAEIIFDLTFTNRPKIKQKQRRKLANQQIFFNPPPTMAELLKFRVPFETCKIGHSMAVCLICKWSGCGDCQKTLQHRHEAHPCNTVFLNLTTGGLFYVYQMNQYEFQSIYINDKLGNRWTPSEDAKQFSLNQKLFNDILDSFMEEDLHSALNRKIKEGRLTKIIKIKEQVISFVN